MPLFGAIGCDKDFKWPSTFELLEMPRDKPIEIAKLRWKKSSQNSNYFGAIQVVLTNGIKSPVFLANGEKAENLIEVAISPQIRRIKGTANN